MLLVSRGTAQWGYLPTKSWLKPTGHWRTSCSASKTLPNMLLTSNFYSVLFNNCEIWLSQGLNVRSKQQILSASANALKILSNRSDLRVSFAQIHSNEKRATPMNFANYRLSIQLNKIYNGSNDNDDWNDMNVQQNFNSRNEFFHINDFSNVKVGKNILCNRLTCLNGLIKLDWLNLSLIAFKLKAKSIFLT